MNAYEESNDEPSNIKWIIIGVVIVVIMIAIAVPIIIVAGGGDQKLTAEDCGEY